MTIDSLFSHPPTKRYKGVIATAHYITMRDGVNIAIDVLLPKNLPTGTKLPTIMVMARYWRSMELRMPNPPNKAPIGPREAIPDMLIEQGFAVVVVDIRGAGASHGVNRHPFMPEEVADFGEIAEWIKTQAWSSGNIGAYGISYEGSTALYLASTGVKGIKGVVPQEIEFDVYADIAFPGGILNAGFIRAWSDSNKKLDNHKTSDLFPFMARLMVKGVRPVDADKKSRVMLKKALQDHQANTDVFDAMTTIIYKDDPFGKTGATMGDFSVFRCNHAIQAGNVPIFSWGSWMDGAAAESALRNFNTFSNPQITVIGAWKHEMSADGNPFNPPKSKPTPLLKHQWDALSQFFQQTLVDDAPPQGKTLYYYTLGADTWSKTDAFPLPNTAHQAWYFGAENSLSTQKPTGESATDRYTVNFDATTGKTNRWMTQMARPVIYANRADEDKELLTYTSAPLGQNMTITGYPVVTLYVASSEADSAFFVYLEDVDENGYVRYITEGQLRGMHRKISTTPPPYVTGMPNHSYKRADGSPLPIGETVELIIGLQPTSVLIKKGHSIRVAIAGADADTFAKIPTNGKPTWTLSRDAVKASHISLPIVY
jgi:putative CocE/NonD family hydrolase